MSQIFAIAKVTVQEAFRQKLAVNLLVFAMALVAASFTISTLTFGEQYRIIVDIGLSSMEIFGTLIVLFLGAGVIARDLERRTLYAVVAKPVSRTTYVVGRYLGIVATATINLFLMAAVFTAVLGYYTRGLAFLHHGPFAAVLGSMVVRFAMVGALATLFSAFSTTTLSAIFTLALVVAGELSFGMVRYWAQQGTAAGIAGRGAFLLIPNLEALNLKEAMVYRDPISASFAYTGIGYGLLYSLAVVALTAFIFSRRDLN